MQAGALAQDHQDVEMLLLPLWDFNPPGAFVCADCDKDMLRYTKCRSLIDMKPLKPAVCGNRQILLTLKCYKCGKPFVK